MSEPTGQRLGRYRLVRRIAKGGMAEVYLARSQGARGFEKTVAIKRILPRYAGDEQFINMMVDEAKITVLLNHPNIAQIIEFGEAEGSYFIVMEYVPGQSLSALNKRLKKRFSERMGVLEATYMVMEMLQGLHAAHAQKDRQGRPANIIHRDVSPQNCLISYDGNTKLIDFGIAKAKDRIERTQIGTIKGKLRYLAPEMIDPGRFGDGGQFDHRVDVFAAGIVLFELVAGRQLFTGDNEFDVYQNITDGGLPNLAEEGLIDDALMRIIERSLQRKATERFATAEDFADELRAFLYRTDPSFKAQRISSLMDRCFPEEKQALANLEAEEPSELSELPQELTFARRESTGNRTKASRKRPRPSSTGSAQPAPGSGRRPAAPSDAGHEPGAATRMSDLQEELGINPSAATQMVAPEHLGELRAGGNHDVNHFDFDDQTVGMGGSGDLTQTGSVDVDETRLAVEPFDENETPATSTQRIQRKPGRGPKWAWVIAAASLLGLVMAVGGVVLTESVLDKNKKTTPADGEETNDGDSDAPPPVASTKGRLTINAVPTTASVALGGGEPEEVPVTLEAEPGSTVTLRFTAPGYKPLTRQVELPKSGADKMVNFELEAERVELIIKVRPKPEGTEVRLDGDLFFEGQKVTPGDRHTVTVKAPGFEPFRKNVVAKAGGDYVVKIKLERDRAEVKKEREKEEEKKRVKRQRDKERDRKAREIARKKEETRKKKASKPGKLKVTVRNVFWADVKIDGKKQKHGAPNTYDLSPGTYKVVVSNSQKNATKSFTVTIKPGRTKTLTVEF